MRTEIHQASGLNRFEFAANVLPRLINVSMIAPLLRPTCSSWAPHSCSIKSDPPIKSGEGTNKDLERFFLASSRSVSISFTCALKRSSSATRSGIFPAVWSRTRAVWLVALSWPSLPETWPFGVQLLLLFRLFLFQPCQPPLGTFDESLAILDLCCHRAILCRAAGLL